MGIIQARKLEWPCTSPGDIDPEALELTNYATQFSAFQQALTELPEMISDPASESSKPLFEPGTEVLINTLGSGGQSLEALTTLFFLLTQLSKCQELIRGYITLDLRGGTLTRTKWHHFISLLSML